MRRHVMLPWTARFFQRSRYKCLYGGRASGKTWAFAHILIIRADQTRVRAACCRFTADSTVQSSRVALIQAIRNLGLEHRFDTGGSSSSITNVYTGSEIFFYGLGTVVKENIRGWEDMDIVWVEEAQALPSETAVILVPTIRKPGSELWFSWNPLNRTDWVWMRFVVNPRAGDVIRKVSWRDVLQFLSPEVLAEKDADLRDNPDLYAHIWEGEPDDSGLTRKVLPYKLLMKCCDLWKMFRKSGDQSGMLHAGLDVADTGVDRNALVSRRGPLVERAVRWRSPTLGQTARRANRWMWENGAAALYYDAGGIGAGVRSHLADMDERPYSLRPENFGSSVTGPDILFSRKVRNKDFFSRRNAQLAWGLRLRAMASERIMDEGPDSVSLDRCLVLHPRVQTEILMGQLTQPVWEEDLSGRVKIDKQPDDAPSPDLFDALALAFAGDSRNGLRMPR